MSDRSLAEISAGIEVLRREAAESRRVFKSLVAVLSDLRDVNQQLASELRLQRTTSDRLARLEEFARTVGTGSQPIPAATLDE